MTEYMKQYGVALIEMGYPITEIVPGTKRAGRKEWQNKPLKKEETRYFAKSGIGILCGREGSCICGLDFDLPDPAVAEQVRAALPDILGETVYGMPLRVGKAPKFLLVCRASEPGWKKATSRVFEKDGVKCQLETLGKGQQFVLHGVHPDTGKEYEVSDLLGGFALPPIEEIPVESLPVITHADVERAIYCVEEILSAAGYTPVGAATASSTKGAAGEDANFDELSDADVRCPDITIARAEQIINDIHPDLGVGSYDTWFSIGRMIFHQFEGSHEGLELFMRVSERFGAEVYDPEACITKWESMRQSDGQCDRPLTFRTLLKQWNAIRDPECSRYDEIGLAHRVMRDYASCIAYLPDVGRWVAFDDVDRRWDQTKGEALVFSYTLDRTIIETLGKELEGIEDEEQAEAVQKFILRTRACASSKVRAVMTLLKGTPSLVRKRSDFDANPELFACANGVIHMPSGRFLREEPDMRCLRHTDVRYDPTAKCPTWEKVILQVLASEEKVRFYKRVMGSVLGGKPTDAYMVLLRGLGKNGKSVIIETTAKVFGGYAEALSEDTLLGASAGGDAGKPRADLAKLSGARLVYVSETTEGSRLKEADVKRMTGGDAITARAPYGQCEMTIHPTWRLVLVTNHPPEVSGDTLGIWRRMADLSCPRTFGASSEFPEDPRLMEKLSAELPGILNWFIEGYREYRALERLELPAEVQMAVDEYRNEQDLVGLWAKENLSPVEAPAEGQVSELTDRQMYDDFQRTLRDDGERRSLTKRQFLRRFGQLVKRGVLSAGTKWTKGSYNVWKLQGYTLRKREEIFE